MRIADATFFISSISRCLGSRRRSLSFLDFDFLCLLLHKTNKRKLTKVPSSTNRTEDGKHRVEPPTRHKTNKQKSRRAPTGPKMENPIPCETQNGMENPISCSRAPTGLAYMFVRSERKKLREISFCSHNKNQQLFLLVCWHFN